MRVLTKNTAGLNQLYKLHQTLRLARRHDVTFCQETKLKIDQMSMIRSKWGSKDVFMSTANTARRGVLKSLQVILSKHLYCSEAKIINN